MPELYAVDWWNVRNDVGCPIVARPAIGSWLFKGLNCGARQASQRMDDKHFRDWIFVDIIQ